MKPIIELRHITKRFPGIVANDDVSLTIQKGEIFALLGENGAGKSTLMSILFGMYEPDEGEIFIRGEKVRITSPSHATKLNIGMVHQHFKLVENFTVTENIVLGMEPKKRVAGIFPTVDIKGTNQKIAELSKRYGLEVEPTAKIEDLSVSVQQRVEILKMLYREAEIMIFDEPTAMLTPQEIESLLQVIRNLRDAGKTIILITHKLEEIKQVADRCAVLCRGKLVSECDVATTSTHDMAYMMVGREVSEEMEKEPASLGKEVLRVENLTVKNAAGFPVVKDVSFSIREGEIFAVAGVSGNGQEELADAIAGMVKAAGGKIYLAGQDITQMPIRKRNESGVAYIPADRHATGMVMDFTLSENLLLKNYYKPPYCIHGWLKRDQFDKKSSELIKQYDIRCGQGCDTIVRSMSGGNQQKAIIGKWLAADARLLIFDEPTRGIDVGAKNEIYQIMRDLANEGKGILMVSSELPELLSVCDRIVVFGGGKIKAVFDAREATEEKIMLAAT